MPGLTFLKWARPSVNAILLLTARLLISQALFLRVPQRYVGCLPRTASPPNLFMLVEEPRLNAFVWLTFQGLSLHLWSRLLLLSILISCKGVKSVITPRAVQSDSKSYS